MIVLINTNTMLPAVGPVGLDYVATTARQQGLEVDILDLCLAHDPEIALRNYFARNTPQLVGLSFRNVDDCFWPSAGWFVPKLTDTIALIRTLTDAKVLLGGVGYSIFAERLIEHTGADFGIRGDGEAALVSLYNQLTGPARFDRTPGLVWRDGTKIHSNPANWPDTLHLPTTRDAIDNAAYFRTGGQCGLETKRGCNRQCIYCADPLAKGVALRLRDPPQVADEAETLLAAGIDVLHLCDSEFNVPPSHALAVCREFIRRSLGRRIRWYAYLSVTPFDEQLAQAMARAGCVGIDFTGDSANDSMLATYRQQHTPQDLARAVRLCRTSRIAVMLDLLLGGPGETDTTVAETIEFVKRIDPDCAGAALGIRLYPGTQMARIAAAQGPPETNGNIRRHYSGSVDLLKPTFYISSALGDRPAERICDLIAGDQRFFEPAPDPHGRHVDDGRPHDHNYNDNTRLIDAIAAGHRGAYWDILRKLPNR